MLGRKQHEAWVDVVRESPNRRPVGTAFEAMRTSGIDRRHSFSTGPISIRRLRWGLRLFGILVGRTLLTAMRRSAHMSPPRQGGVASRSVG